MKKNTRSDEKSKKAVVAVLIALAVVATIIAAVVAFTTNQSAEKKVASEASGTVSTEASNSAESAKITFTDEGFSPTTLTVKKGTKVTVENKSSNELEFSSNNHPSHTDDPELNMSILQPGESGSFTPNTVGTHGFHDHIDDSKTGTIIVTD